MPRGRVGEEVEQYQELVCHSLGRIFGENEVIKEWDAAKDSQDDFRRGDLYCPRIDVAVGPFNIDRRIEINNERIRASVREHRDFLRNVFSFSEQRDANFEDFLANLNPNPRCFLAIEIENSGSSKHMLGNIANVSILGHIGVVIPFNDSKFALCGRIKNYVSFASQVGKIESVFRNVLVVSKENFLRLLGEKRQ